MWTCTECQCVDQYVDVCRICVVYQEVGVDSILVCGSICGRVQYISIWTCAEYQYVDQYVDVCCISVCGRVQNVLYIKKGV